MKNVIVFHGYSETPESYWYPYLKKELKAKDYKVIIPQLPNTNDPKLHEQLGFSLKNISFNRDSILIGHSSGVPLILALLEKIDIKVMKSILVAGYTTALKTVPDDPKNIKDSYDWNLIKKHCERFIIINADNDPWGADDKQGKKMHRNLGGKLIINHEGHMGSDSFNQPYKEFPSIIGLI